MLLLCTPLQPDFMVDELIYGVCDYNRPGKVWRGEVLPIASWWIQHDQNTLWIRNQTSRWSQRRFEELSSAEQTALLHKRSRWLLETRVNCLSKRKSVLRRLCAQIPGPLIRVPCARHGKKPRYFPEWRTFYRGDRWGEENPHLRFSPESSPSMPWMYHNNRFNLRNA